MIKSKMELCEDKAAKVNDFITYTFLQEHDIDENTLPVIGIS